MKSMVLLLGGRKFLWEKAYELLEHGKCIYIISKGIKKRDLCGQEYAD
jgi:hypothetical protein